MKYYCNTLTAVCNHIISFLLQEINQLEKEFTKICQVFDKELLCNRDHIHLWIQVTNPATEKYLKHFDLLRWKCEYRSAFVLFSYSDVLQRPTASAKAAAKSAFSGHSFRESLCPGGRVGSVTISVCFSWKSNSFSFFPSVRKNIQINQGRWISR